MLHHTVISFGGAMSVPSFCLCNGSAAPGTTLATEAGAYCLPFRPSHHSLIPRSRVSHICQALPPRAHFPPLPDSRGLLRSLEPRKPFCLPRVRRDGGADFFQSTDDGDGNGKGGKGNRNNGGGGDDHGEPNWGGWICRWIVWYGSNVKMESLVHVSPLLSLSLFGLSHLLPATAFARISGNDASFFIWEIRGGKRRMLVPGPSGEDFAVVDSSLREGGDHVEALFLRFEWLLRQLKDGAVRMMLPDGYPASVTSDYLEYSLWRGVQGIASQVSGVLSTQALLYAVGLGKGAIPTAAAVNWVLKDGLGYLSKIVLSKYGRHFDVSPKGWRLFADLLENAAYGLEILTPAFPHLFVPIGAAAGAGRSAAALIQAATRSCFFAGFAAERNFAEVIAKGEAQGMVSKFLGIALGISLANAIGSSTPLALAAFAAVTCVHMYSNLKSYQSIQLRTLNPYRGSLLFSEYLLSGQVPGISEVNEEEPLFPEMPIKIRAGNNNGQQKERQMVLSQEAKGAAQLMVQRLRLGAPLSEIVQTKNEAMVLFDLFRDERYMLIQDRGRYNVVLREESGPEDMLKSLFHASYLYWLERNLGSEPGGIEEDCGRGGRLRMSLDYVQREFGHVQDDGRRIGWTMDGLIARPLPTRIRLGGIESSP